VETVTPCVSKSQGDPKQTRNLSACLLQDILLTDLDEMMRCIYVLSFWRPWDILGSAPWR